MLEHQLQMSRQKAITLIGDQMEVLLTGYNIIVQSLHCHFARSMI